jgi:hypothetical protein
MHMQWLRHPSDFSKTPMLYAAEKKLGDGYKFGPYLGTKLPR